MVTLREVVHFSEPGTSPRPPLAGGTARCLRPGSAKGGQPPSPSYAQESSPTGPRARLRAHSTPAAQLSGSGCRVQAPTWSAAGFSPTRTQPRQAPPRPQASALAEAFRARPPKAELDSSRELGGPGGRGAGRAWLDPAPALRARKLCPPAAAQAPLPSRRSRSQVSRGGESSASTDDQGLGQGRRQAGQAGRPGAGDQIRRGWGALGQTRS